MSATIGGNVGCGIFFILISLSTLVIVNNTSDMIKDHNEYMLDRLNYIESVVDRNIPKRFVSARDIGTMTDPDVPPPQLSTEIATMQETSEDEEPYDQCYSQLPQSVVNKYWPFGTRLLPTGIVAKREL